MTFMTLVTDLHRETGAGSVAPSTALDQVGEAGRLVDWIKQANLFIQNKHTDWLFLWSQESFVTVDGNDIETPPADLAGYDRDTFFIDGEPLEAVNYIEVKQEVRESGTGKPYRVVIMPDGTLRMDQIPNGAYTITYDYWTSAVGFSSGTENDNDVSLIPERFHQAIVGLAMTYYAMYEEAPEILNRGQVKYMEWLPQLESNQLPGDRHMHSTAEGNDMVIEVE